MIPPLTNDATCSGGQRGKGRLIGGHRRSHGEGKATHSSILAWRIPWTEEPGGLQSMGRQELDLTEQLTHTEGILDLRGGKRTSAPWLCEEVVWPARVLGPRTVITLPTRCPHSLREHILSGCPPPQGPHPSDALAAPELLPS